MKLAIIRNDFHNTEARVKLDPRCGWTVLSAAVQQRVRATLCGIRGCTCGGVLSERGPQDVQIEEFAGGKVTLFHQ